MGVWVSPSKRLVGKARHGNGTIDPNFVSRTCISCSCLGIQGTIYISVILVFASIATLFFYMWRYACYAIEDPDRLQAEEFRYEMKRMHVIAAKELPQPIPVNELNLSEPTVNPEIGEPDGEIARGKQ